MTERELGLLGLGSRSGALVVGTAGVRAALKRDELALVVVASDHSARTGDKVLRLARAKGVGTVIGPAAAQLGRRLGRPAVQTVGVRDEQLAAGFGGVRQQKDARRP